MILRLPLTLTTLSYSAARATLPNMARCMGRIKGVTKLKTENLGYTKKNKIPPVIEIFRGPWTNERRAFLFDNARELLFF
jgi:hypothetical protein